MPGPTNFIWPFPQLTTGALGYDPDPIDPDPDPVTPPDWAHASNSGFILVAEETSVVVDDLNLDGTVTDGGGGLTFVNPANANDGNNATIASRSGFAAGPGTYTSRLKTDLGVSAEVTGMVVRGGLGGSGDVAWVVYSSPDGSSWTVASSSRVWVSGVVTITLDTPTTARYWRIEHSVTHVGLQSSTWLNVNSWEISGEAFTGATIWTPAPAVHDSDDATYAACTAGDEVLRIVLDAARLIYRAELRIATDTSGSKTYEIFGTNEPDFSSPVSLDSLTFTATGSYTAQEVVFEWTPTTAYRFYIIEGPDEDVRFHDLNLLGAMAPSGGVLAHPGLTDRDVADQHPATAVSLSDAAGLFTGTEVETGLAELARRTIGVDGTGANTGAAETFDAATSWYVRTVDANCTFTLIAAPSGTASALFLELVKDGTPTIDLPASVVNASALETAWAGFADGDVAFLTLWSRDGGTTWYGAWVGGTSGGAGASTLDDLTDVTITAPTADDDLRYNGSAWVNDARVRSLVTNGFDSLVWEGDDLTWEWSS